MTLILTLLAGPAGAANAVTGTASGTFTAAVDTASGPVGSAAATRVGASTIGLASFVGAAGNIAAGQRRDDVLPQPGSVSATSVAAEDASGFVGRKGVTKTFDDGSSASYGGEMRVPRGTNAPGEVGGRQYSGHAFDQMQGRGITPSVVDDAITSGQNLGGGMYYSSANNVSVVVNSQGRVITVGYGQFKPR